MDEREQRIRKAVEDDTNELVPRTDTCRYLLSLLDAERARADMGAGSFVNAAGEVLRLHRKVAKYVKAARAWLHATRWEHHVAELLSQRRHAERALASELAEALVGIVADEEWLEGEYDALLARAREAGLLKEGE